MCPDQSWILGSGIRASFILCNALRTRPFRYEALSVWAVDTRSERSTPSPEMDWCVNCSFPTKITRVKHHRRRITCRTTSTLKYWSPRNGPRIIGMIQLCSWSKWTLTQQPTTRDIFQELLDGIGRHSCRIMSVVI